MATLQFYPIDVTYKVVADKAVIYLFGRTPAGEQVCVIDERFQPYFYVLPKKLEDIDFLLPKLERFELKSDSSVSKVVRVEIVEKNFIGEKVTALQVFANLPGSVPNLRSEIKNWKEVANVLEADILYTRRYLIDKVITPLTLTDVEGEFDGIRSRVPVFKADKISQTSNDALNEPRMLAFDIESYNPGGGATINMEKYPILMISFYGKNFRKVISAKKFEANHEDWLEFVEGEAKLLERFKEVVNEYKPDLLVGYNSDGFDVPYIKTRADKYRINMDIGLDYSPIRVKPGNTDNIQISGIVSLDIYKFIIRVVSRKLKTESYKLDLVAKELLGKSKIQVDLNSLGEAWDKTMSAELEKYAEYNLNDSLLTYELCEKILPNIIELVKIVGLPLYDINGMGFSQLVEWHLLKQAPQFNELAPNRPSNEEMMKRRMHSYQGAFVYEPTPGLFHDIAVFDFRSLYPSIIVSHNVSPSTLNCSCCASNPQYIPVTEMKKEKAWFCQKKKGFIPAIIEEIILRRVRVKEIMKKATDPTEKMLLDARQESLKVLSNSFYGYLGFAAARWYSIESANAITAYGRYYVKRVIDKSKSVGFDVLYGDTDSIFLLMKGKSKDDVKKFADSINLELTGIMELDLEAFYSAGIFVSAKQKQAGAKKKYALISEDGYLKIRGFETVRRNWSFVAKDAQEAVLKIILKENNKEKALDYIKKTITDLRDKKIPVEKVTINMQLQKNINEYDNVGPHVAVAQRMKNAGAEVGPGSLIKFVICSGNGRVRDRAKLPQECASGEYDADYYINNQVVPAVESILSVLGYGKDDLLQNSKQRSLLNF